MPMHTRHYNAWVVQVGDVAGEPILDSLVHHGVPNLPLIHQTFNLAQDAAVHEQPEGQVRRARVTIEFLT